MLFVKNHATMSLEPIEPEQARELYLTHREPEVSEATLYAHKKRLGKFLEWCEIEDIDNMNVVTGRKLQEFRLWRRADGNLAPPSEKSQIDTLRVFIRFVESIDGVRPNLSEKVISPSLDPEDNIRDEMLESEHADEVLRYLAKYEYASYEHVAIAIMWHTMCRLGRSARSMWMISIRTSSISSYVIAPNRTPPSRARNAASDSLHSRRRSARYSPIGSRRNAQT